MTYEPYEISEEQSQPVELYTIQLGVDVWRYTSADGPFTIASETWEPFAISRTPFEESQEEQGQNVEVRLPGDAPICRRYIATVPGESATIRIERVQELDAALQRIVVLDGVIQTVSFEKGGEIAVLSVVTLRSAYSRTLPRDVYSAVCNHVLYDDRCKVAEASYRVTQEVLSVSGNLITINNLNLQSDGYWVPGFVELTGSVRDFRVVLAHTGNVLTLPLPFSVNPTGELVRVYAGCDHSPQTCNTKFSNLLNFGGYPFVPTKNPFQTGLK